MSINDDDLIDAGLTPKESPVERALQSLANAVEDTALAVMQCETKDELRAFREALEAQIVKLETQSEIASTFLTHFDERRKP